MKNNKIHLCLMLFLLMCMTSLKAQNTTRDVVFLKNGSIIKGSVVELDSSASVKIQTADGSIFVYAMTEVEKIEKETIIAPQPAVSSLTTGSPNSAVPAQVIPEPGKPKFSIYGGVAIPTGDFTKQGELGYAETGFTFGIQVVGAGQVSFLVDASYASNPNNLGELKSLFVGGNVSTSSWGSILVLTGLKIGTTNATGANFFFAPVFGINIGTSPKVDFSSSITTFETYPYNGYVTTTIDGTFSSATSTALAYGMMLEVNVGRVIIGARYVASKPTYKASTEVTVTGLYNARASGSETIEQSTSIIQMFIGIGL